MKIVTVSMQAVGTDGICGILCATAQMKHSGLKPKGRQQHSV